MAVLANLPGLDIISGFKGTLDFYVFRGTPCCRSWPRSPGHRRSAAVEAQWPVFTAAASLWTTLDENVQQAYIRMAEDSTLTGRDMCVKMYINAHSILPY